MGGKILRRAQKDLKERIKKAKRIIFFLDYDGTLTPIRRRPSLARIDGKTKALLKKLADLSFSKVFIISGRSLADIKRIIGIKSVYYIGNHGVECQGPHFKYINRAAKNLIPTMQKCYKVLKEEIEIKGVILENKKYTLSLHYRLVKPHKAPALKKIFAKKIKELSKNKKIKITEGKKVLEIRPNINWNKGKIVNWVLKRSKKTLPICIGDDITDEDAFKALGKKGISILVSKKRRETLAQYRLESPREVIKFLKVVWDC